MLSIYDDLTHRFEGRIKLVDVEPTPAQHRASVFALLVYSAALTAWTVSSNVYTTAAVAAATGIATVGYYALS